MLNRQFVVYLPRHQYEQNFNRPGTATYNSGNLNVWGYP